MDRIIFKRIDTGPHKGKYYYKVANFSIENGVSMPGGSLLELVNVKSLIDAYITANKELKLTPENVKIFYNGNIVTDLNQQIRADGSYQVIVTLPNNKLELRF